MKHTLALIALSGALAVAPVTIFAQNSKKIVPHKSDTGNIYDFVEKMPQAGYDINKFLKKTCTIQR
ncbi:MAG: hypothetical protein EBX41_07370 [Chitinophagia bacterium]|nr:hypothetical protein [Chitinophagia bacterium]